ncbi:MAG: hypothetical protein IJN74_06875 [Clostridia bacterium]|nr:hypothetical protein [Clostridia bacterium]
MILGPDKKQLIIGFALCAIVLVVWTKVFGSMAVYLPIFLFIIVVLFYSNKKTVKLRRNIDQARKIICEGPAQLTGAKGYMFLSNDALEFYGTDKTFGVEKKNFAILPSDFKAVEAQGRKLYIETKDQTIEFKVYKAEVWKEQIVKTMLEE